MAEQSGPIPPHHRLWTGVVVLLLSVVGGVWYAAAGHTVPVEPPKPNPTLSTRAQRTPDRVRVLFLGNSFTQFNGGMAVVMSRLCESAGITPRPVFDQVTIFGARLEDLYEAGTAVEAIRQGGWDFVVLQDYSLAAVIYRKEMDEYGRKFCAEARAVDAKPIFFMTWARSDEPKTLRTIAGAYTAVAMSNGAPIAPVGLAWEAAVHGRPTLDLYQEDKKHPNGAGTYLTACVFYSVLFDKSPHGLTASVVDGKTTWVDLSRIDATYLQDVAWETVQKFGRKAQTRPTTRQGRSTTMP